MRSFLLGAVILMGAGAPALANPIHFRSTDGCYDTIHFQFVTSLISARNHIVEITEPTLQNKPSALLHVQVDFGQVTWPAAQLYPNLSSVDHDPHPFYVTEQGKWFLWDNYGWSAGEKINVQATMWNGTCMPSLGGVVITR
jgi:hypothetical protein